MRARSTPYLIAAALGSVAAGAVLLLRAPRAGPSTAPPGRRKAAKTRLLEIGSLALQGSGPLGRFDIYLVGFHPMKDDPGHQMEAHHFCRQVNEDFMECVLFDGNTAQANLIGIEYIVSERLFERLPEAEWRFWHPHNGEILSGQLIAPGLPEAAETALLAGKINSYGKTWHTWDTGSEGHPGDELPLGEAKLMWSFNRLGEARASLIELRDRHFGVDTEAKRRARAHLAAAARPQEGVDALKGRFPGPTHDIPGVRERDGSATGAATVA